MTTAPPPALRLMDRYIFKQLLDYFLLGVVVFTLIAFFSDTLLNFIREIQKYGIPISTTLTLIGLQLPKSIALVLPASCFLAVLMVFNHLNNQFEIITLRMSGISLWRLMVPALLLGILCSGLAYWLSDYVVPWCNTKTEQIKQQVIRSGSLPANGNSFMFRAYDPQHNLVQMIYVSQYEGRKLGDSTIIDLSKPNVMQVVQSRSGTWDPQQGWELRDANIYLVSKDAEHSSAGHSETFWVRGLINNQQEAEKRREETQRSRKGIDTDSDQNSFLELLDAIQKRETMHAQGKNVRPVAISTYLDLWDKVTLPLSSLVIILSAVPLALTPPRQNSNRGFVFAIVILFLYYQLDSIFNALARLKIYELFSFIHLPTYLALVSWLPLVIMAAIGLVLIQRKSQVL